MKKTDMAAELKPCPFCGGKAVLKYHKGSRLTDPAGQEKKIPNLKGWWGIGCNTYDCILFYNEFNNQSRLIFKSGAKKEIVEKWNRREVAPN